MPVPQEFAITIQIPTVAGGTGEVQYASWPYSFGGTLVALRFTPDVNVAAHDTNYTDLSVEIDGSEVASEQTTTGDTGNLTAGTDIAMAITGTGAALNVVQNSVIAFKKTDAGAGVNAGGTVVALFKPTPLS